MFVNVAELCAALNDMLKFNLYLSMWRKENTKKPKHSQDAFWGHDIIRDRTQQIELHTARKFSNGAKPQVRVLLCYYEKCDVNVLAIKTVAGQIRICPATKSR